MNATPPPARQAGKTAEQKAAVLKEVKVAAARAARARVSVEDTRIQRDARIVAAASVGATYHELSAATGLSYDRVKQILNPKKG